MYRLSAICHFALEGCLRSSGLLIPRRGFNTALAGAPRATKWRRRAGSRGVAEPAGAARARRQEGGPARAPPPGILPRRPGRAAGARPSGTRGGRPDAAPRGTAPAPGPAALPSPPAPPPPRRFPVPGFLDGRRAFWFY